MQDRLAAAYLWQALLEHKATMEDNLRVESPQELSESYDTGEVLVHIFFFFRGCVNQAPVVQKVDNAIHWINHYPVDCYLIYWIVIYPVNSQGYPMFEQPGPEIYGNGLGVVRCDT